mmetsp:Transcript_23048/g.46120  ORF Transcript_23048/g.46120 Transcript_23048/m.46120 type:complete len:300 (-) Transcript_23048:137-1036(-)
MASRGGGFYGKASHWGDIILSNATFRDTTPAVAMCYCEVAKLTRSDLLAVLDDHPAMRSTITQCGLKLAMRRAMLIISVYAKLHLQKQKQVRRQTSGRPCNANAPNNSLSTHQSINQSTDHNAPGGAVTVAAAPGGAVMAAAAKGAAGKASLPAQVEELRPDRVLLQVQAGLGNVDYFEVEAGQGGHMKMVRKSDRLSRHDDEEEHKKLGNLAFLSELKRAPNDQKPMLLATKLLELQAKTDATVGRLDGKMDSITNALGAVAEKLGVPIETPKEPPAASALPGPSKLPPPRTEFQLNA